MNNLKEVITATLVVLLLALSILLPIASAKINRDAMCFEKFGSKESVDSDLGTMCKVGDKWYLILESEGK